MKTEVFDDKTAFLEALHGRARKSTRRTPSARPGASGEPTAALSRERSPATGLSTLLLAGWCNEYNAAMEMRLYKKDVSTQFYTDERQACQAARLLAEQGEAK